MNKYIKQLLDLIQQRPELPIIPMVDYEVVCGDESSRWMGSFGSAEVTKYVCGEEHIFFYDESEMEPALREIVGDDWYDASNEENDLEKYRSLAWTECIAVDINTP